MILSDLLSEYKELVKLHLEVDVKKEIRHISSEQAPTKNSLVFVSKVDSVIKALEAQAAALVVPEAYKDKVPQELPINVLTTPNPRLALALISKGSFAIDKLKHQYSTVDSDTLKSLSFVHPSAQVHASCIIGPHAFVGPDVKIEKNVIIGASASIQSQSTIGEGSRIHEGAFVGHRSQIGKFCEVYMQTSIGSEGFGYATDSEGAHNPIPHEGHVVLEDYVHIGAGSQIDRGTFGETSIGKHTKLDNLCHIAHNCQIGKSCLITAGFKVAGSTKIGDFFTTGGGVTVAGHIEICDHVNVAGLSAIHKSVTKPGSYYGYPLKPLKEGLRNNAAFGNLGLMRKDLKKALKKLGIEESK